MLSVRIIKKKKFILKIPISILFVWTRKKPNQVPENGDQNENGRVFLSLVVNEPSDVVYGHSAMVVPR